MVFKSAKTTLAESSRELAGRVGRAAPTRPLLRWRNIHTYIRGDGKSVTEILDSAE